MKSMARAISLALSLFLATHPPAENSPSFADALSPYSLFSENAVSLVESVSFFTGKEKQDFTSLSVGVIAIQAMMTYLFFFPFNYHAELWSQTPVFRAMILLLSAVVVLKHIADWILFCQAKKPVPLEASPGKKVALATTCVPTNEPIDILKKTLIEMKNVTYPHDTWVLDEENDPRVQELARELGVLYFSRKGKSRYQSGSFEEKTKPGNINSWLDETGFNRNYEYVAFLDVDQIPEPHFLDKVLGYFRDPNVHYVQSPQIYYNQPEGWVARGADEMTLQYYSITHPAFYGLGMTLMDGAHTTYRMETLKKMGGLPVHLGEDLMASLLWSARGFKGVYTTEILAQGINPPDLVIFLKQRYRWALANFDIRIRQLHKYFSLLTWKLKLGFLYQGSHYFAAILSLGMETFLAVFLIAGQMIPLSWHFIAGSALLLLLEMQIHFWKNRYIVYSAKPAPVFWRAGILAHALTPYVVKALAYTLLGKKGIWTNTVKGIKGNHSLLALKEHLFLAAFLSLAVGISLFFHSFQPLHIFALLFLVPHYLVLCGLLFGNKEEHLSTTRHHRFHAELSNKVFPFHRGENNLNWNHQPLVEFSL